MRKYDNNLKNILCSILGCFMLLILFLVPINVKAIDVGDIKSFEYTNGIQVYPVEVSGYYQLEVWGAQGGNQGGYHGGYGGYATGVALLGKGSTVYVAVGGQGIGASYQGQSLIGGYNGGGNVVGVGGINHMTGSGGGATHIATTTGLLSTLSGKRDSILIVAGGGGGARNQANHVSAARWGHGGSGGGYIAGGAESNYGSTSALTTVTGVSGTQTSGYAFGQGGPANGNSAGGGGYYGGLSGSSPYTGSGGGGSGYIGNPSLKSFKDITKKMYCYNCQETSEENIYTVRTTNVSSTSVSNYAKTGNGSAKIRLVALADTDARLQTITISGTKISERFDPDTYTYDVNVDSNNYEIDVDAIPVKSTTTVAGLGTYTLKIGNNPITLTGTAESGDTITYTLNVYRPASDYKYLTDITVNGKTVGNFNPTTLDYTINLPYDTDTVELDAVYGHLGQNVDGLGTVKVPTGTSTKKIEVMSEDRQSTTTYNIHFVREHSSKLKSVTMDKYDLEPKFDPNTNEYIVNIMNSTLSLSVDAIPYDEEAKVSLKGFGYINQSITATITVTEPNSAPTIYTFKIIKDDAPVVTPYEFPYNGKIQTFTAPMTGYYRLEAWGAQGGSVSGYYGGYGGYATGTIMLKKDETIFVVPGGKGIGAGAGQSVVGGYNGGGGVIGDGRVNHLGGSGGGATHIARETGLLSSLSDNKDSILIVAGGGGGARNQPNHEPAARWGHGGAGGGATAGYTQSTNGTMSIRNVGLVSGTQTSGNAFGQGATATGNGAGGGGYFGGYSGDRYNFAYTGTGGGGSGYIGNKDVFSYRENTKVMYCYNCPTSETEDTYTENTGNYSVTPTSYYAKSGDGYARITLLEQPSENNFLSLIRTDKGELSPKYSMDNQNYTVELTSEDDEITISAALEDDRATMTGIGTFDVPAGSTDFPITVTAENGDIRIYTVTVSRPASSNAKPLNISISGLVPALCAVNEKYCQLSDEFDPDIHEYSITVPSRIKNLEFTVNKGHKYQKVVGEGVVQLKGGMNDFTIEVESEDGTNIEKYTYHIDRDMTGNANIEMLEVTDPNVDINFDPDITDYFFSVPNEYTQVDLKVTLEDENATYKIFNNENFAIGLNNVIVEVTAENGEVKSYILNIYREQSGNTFLNDLTVSKDGENFELSPVFNKVISTYVVNVRNDIDEVEINATAEHSLTTISGTGKKTLKTGTNTYDITTTAEDGSVQVYSISIIRAKNSDATLKTLDVLESSLTPSFESNTFKYSLTVNPGVTSLNINAIPNSPVATVQIQKNSGFAIGNNTVNIVVTAEDGSQNTYVLDVYRTPSSNTYLKSLSTDRYDMTNIFDKTVEEYNFTVENDVNTIAVTALPEDPLSTVAGATSYNLKTGDNQISVTVMAEDGSIRVYKLNVFRKLNNNANLALLSTSGKAAIAPEFDKDTLDYHIDLTNEENKITVIGAPEASTSTVSGNGEYTVPTGETAIPIVVTAEDGTKKTYTLTVDRKKSDNANASMIIAKESVLSPKFDKNETNYILKVTEPVTSLTLNVTLEDSAATYKVVGNENFKLGEYNNVEIIVTAEDGTEKTYTLKVLRQEAGTTSNRLEWLAIDKGTLNPSFKKDTNYYEVEVDYTVDKVTLTGELEDANATVTGLTTYPLNVGVNVLGVEVTSVEGVSRSYQVIVTRKQNNEARLASLQVMGSALSPNFHRDVYEYQTTTTLTSLTINAAPIDPNATYEIIGNHDFALGHNEVIVRVTAADGVVTKDYVINVEKEKSNNNNLASLEVLGHKFKPDFSKTTTVYYLDVDRDCQQIQVEATPEDINATVDGTGNIDLGVGVNYVEVTVTSESGQKKVYTIIVTRKGSSNNYLESLTTSDGILSPEFNKTVNEYRASVPYETEVIGLNGKTEDEHAFAVGLERYSLDVGENILYITVIAEDGTTNIYTVTVTREEPVSSQLKNIIVKDYELNQEFVKDVYDYNITVNNEVTSLDLTIIPIDKGATYTVVGNENFVVGMNQVEIIVYDRNGGGPSTYVLNVNRQNYANTYLAYIYPNVGKLSPDFDKTNLSYTVTVENEVDTIDISAEPEITTNTLTGAGKYTLQLGENKIPLTVSTPSGITRTYYVTVVRQLRDFNHLLSLEVKANGQTKTLNPTFDKNTYEYHVDVEAGTANIQINATAEDGATISGIGNKTIKVGENNFDIKVTAENGDERIYKLTVNREASSNCNLIDIIPSVGTLSPTFSYNRNDYSITLDSSASLLSFEVITEDRFATVTGHEKAVIPDGESTREIVVTAEDGSKKTYTIHIHKDRSDEARLKSLSIDGYTLNETFDPDTYRYSISVPNDKNTILSNEIEALPMDSNATVTKTSSLILSSTATNMYTIIVTANDGFTTQTYTIAIDRAKGNDSTLAKLEFPYGKFSPVFNPATRDYTLLVPRDITKINQSDVTAVPTDPDAMVSLPETFTYDETNDTYEVVVTSPDKTTTTTYKVHLGLLKSSDATLKELTTSEGKFNTNFEPNVFSYTVPVRDDLDEITINAVPTDDPYATVVSGTGTFPLTEETTTFDIIVIAEDGTTNIYTLTVEKSLSTEKYLKDLYLSGDCTEDTCQLSPEYREDTLEYKATVEHEIEKINIEAVKYHNSQTVRFYDNVTGNEITNTDITLKTGVNVFRIEVENSVGDKITYKLTVQRKLSSNNYLKYLRFADPEVELEFDKDQIEYFVTIPSTYDSVKLEYEPEVSTSSVRTQGTTYLMPGNNDVKVIVTAQDGQARTYTIHVEKEKGYNNYLQSITVSSGIIYPLTPKFNKLVYNYVSTVPYNVSKIKLDAVAEDVTTTVSGIGQKELRVGTNVFQIVTTAATGETAVYNVVITREKSTRLYLKQLDINNATRVEDFNKDRFIYNIDTPSDVDRLDMTIVPELDDVTYRVVGNNNLKTGENTVIIVLENSDKTVTTTYKLNVNKRASSDNFLKNLKVNGEELITPENINENYFEVTIPYDSASVEVEGIPRAETSSVISGNGTYSLDFGVNQVFLTVIAEDGSVRNYELDIKRKYDNHLLMITTDHGELVPEFEKDTLFYYVNVPREVTDITVIGVQSSPLTTVTGNGTYELEVGENLIYLTVSARDKTSRTYILHVNRLESDNNYIKSFSALDSTRVEDFDREKTDYTLLAPYNTKSLDFNVELEEPHATYRIEGNENFKEGDNPVKIIVTAENGDERIYDITVRVQEEALYSNRLLDLTVENQTLTPTFDPDTTSYTVTVPYSTEKVKVNAVLESVSAKVTGLGEHNLMPGRNEIPVVVTSKDNKIRVYTVIVYRTKSSDPRLRSVSFEGYTFSPLFDKDNENYTLHLDSSVTSLNEKVEPLVPGTTYVISGNKNLQTKPDKITIVATAEDGVTTKTYTFNIEQELSHNDYLDSLSTNLWDLTPAFDKTNTGPYVINVDSDINSIVFSGKPEATTSTVDGLGFHNLSEGRNVFPIVVTSEMGTTRTYTVVVNKAKSDENHLMFLGVNEGKLSPTFDPDVLEYNVDVDETISEITVVAYSNDGATITGDGVHKLVAGENTIDVVVTAEDGSVRTYTLHVKKAELISSKILDLRAHEGMLAPEFEKNTTDYVVRVPNEINSLTFDITLEDPTATYEIHNNENFVVGPNPVEIVVTDRNGGQTIYTLTVVKRPEVENYLKDIQISEGELSPAFTEEINYYEVEVDASVDSIDVKGILKDESATLEGNGVYSLKAGANYIYLNVTSMKGFLRTYTLKVTRKTAENNKLLSLSVDPGTLNPAFEPDVNSYQVDVDDNVHEITISANGDETATITGTGKQILAIGDNHYEVVVTAEDGSVNVYEINVHKEASSNNNIVNIIPSAGALSPSYTNTVDTYEVEVEEDTTIIDFDVILENPAATVTGHKDNYLNYGDNPITITVTAEDGTERQVSINVIRNRAIKEIILDDFLLMEKGDVVTLEPTLLPEDAINKELIWEVEDPSVVTVEDGTVTALTLGDTTITVSSKQNPEVKKVVNVSVLNLSLESDVYEVRRDVVNLEDQDAIKNIVIGPDENETLAEFLSNLNNKETLIHFYDIEGNEITDLEATPVSTSIIVKLEYNGKVYDTAYIAVRGETTFDQYIDVDDLNLVIKQILGKETYNNDHIIFKTSDIEETDEVDVDDFSKLKKYILGKITSLNK